MATIAVSKIKPYSVVNVAKVFYEGASQSFVEGDVVILSGTSDKGNKIVIAGTDPVTKIVGIAQEAASGTEGGREIPVVLSDPRNEFIANVEGTTALDADFVGLRCGLVNDGSGIWRVDTSDTTNKNVRITGLIDAVGDVKGRVTFRFLDIAAAFSGYSA